MIYQTQSGAEYDGNCNFAKKDFTFFPASTPSNIADMTQIPSEIRIAEVTDIFYLSTFNSRLTPELSGGGRKHTSKQGQHNMRGTLSRRPLE